MQYRSTKKTNRETDNLSFSFRAAPRCSTCSARFQPYTATYSEAPGVGTVPYHSARSALGASGARIRFSPKYSAAVEVSMLKENGITGLHPHVPFLFIIIPPQPDRLKDATYSYTRYDPKQTNKQSWMKHPTHAHAVNVPTASKTQVVSRWDEANIEEEHAQRLTLRNFI